MRITRLEIFGFKSFRDRFVLNFDHDIIGIVGPNGCGKSNIVDALRWVLGETHAKHLRGTLLEDLIFNGSESQRPLGMAEVSIVIRPDENWTLKSAAADSMLAPVNGHAKEGAAEVAAADGNEQSPKEEGDKVVELQPTTLLDLPGLLDAAEIQLTRRLYRSGESEYFINRTPCRLRDMTDLYRLIGLGARGLSIVQQGTIGEFISKKPIERRELLEEAAGISGFRARIEAAQRRLERTAENMARLNDITIEVDRQVRSLKRQAERAERRNRLKEELQLKESRLFELRCLRLVMLRADAERELTAIDHTLNGLRAELAKEDAQELQLRASLDEFDIKLTEVRRRRDELMAALDHERAKENEVRVGIARREARLRAIDDEARRISERTQELKRLEEELSTSVEGERAGLTNLELTRAAAEERLVAVQSQTKAQLENNQASQAAIEVVELSREVERLTPVTEELRASEQEERKLRSRLLQHREQLGKARVRQAACEGEIASVNKHLSSIRESAVKNTLKSTTAADEILSGASLARVLLEDLKVSAEYRKAVESLIGVQLEFLVTDDADSWGEQFAQNLAQSAQGRDLRLGVISSGLVPPSGIEISSELLAVAPSVRPMLAVIEANGDAQTAIKLLLARAFVADNFHEALKLGRVLREKLRGEQFAVATTSGEVVTHWGWYTTAGEGALLELTGRLDGLRAKLAEHSLEIEQLENEREKLEAELRTEDERRIAFAEERERLLGLQKRVSELLRQEQAVEREQREQLLAIERACQNEVRAAASAEAIARRNIEHQCARVAEMNAESERLAKRMEVILRDREEINSESQVAQISLAEWDSLGGGEGRERIAQLENQSKVLKEELTQVESERSVVRDELGRTSQNVTEAREQVQRLADSQRELALNIERSSTQLQVICEEYAGEGAQFWLTADSENVKVQELANEFGSGLEAAVHELQQETLDVRKRLEKEGEVDSQSIELYQSESIRLAELETQLKDLRSAHQTLTDTIAQLKAISRERFMSAFEFVSTKFTELVPRLFGGGSGKMELLQAADILESGVELSVRPPGKNLRSLELMSGGEKALTATAVIMSMFLYRPSPVCVLDEVDAPLDDVNLERLLVLVREISESTQFLVVTHNKLTMGASDRLIGITMQERGVSTALSVSLERGEELLAANM